MFDAASATHPRGDVSVSHGMRLGFLNALPFAATVLAYALASALVLCAFASTALARGPELPRRGPVVQHERLLVRLSVSTPTPELKLGRVEEEVRAIWAPYLDIVVVTSAAECVEDTDWVHVRIGSDPPPIREALAWILFENGVPTREIVASLPQTHAMFQNSTWRIRRTYQLTPALTGALVAQALGRAIAHEIGHYVLRSAQHEPTGLMRERFSADDAVWPRGHRFRLSGYPASASHALGNASTSRRDTDDGELRCQSPKSVD